ncbi:Peptidoglycan D,D-transpeptidase MrdA [hydrothermal vent metagenome]|uniref:Peptidoglycan D,D-transpeptidase MrdA n=1 Tax=hydrothermal vent metagenome TaxID=652676 RepID=A0A3B0V0E6_9ZZZZ
MLQSPKQIKNSQSESRSFSTRIFISVAVILLIIVVILSRFFYLQVIQHQALLSSSEKNKIKTTALPPARGFIYDRNGELLVDNLPTYRLQIIPEKIANLKQKLVEIQTLINLSDSDIKEILAKEKNNQPFKPIIVKSKLSEHELSAFIARKHIFIGFDAKAYLIRHYKHTNILAHVVGYVGRINAKDTSRLSNKRYLGTEYTGKNGLERFYENKLHGQPGSLTVETNAQGRVLNTVRQVLPTSGEDITLTIDIHLQKTAYDALGDLTGSIIAINPKNGEILAMVSKPGFDPNDFVNGISQAKYSALINSQEKPLFNRSIKGGYEPGSTIKPYIALAGLYYNIIDINYSMFSTGYYQLPNQKRKYHDWKKGGHGTTNIEQSLAQSVNTFYYSLAVQLGIDRIHDFLIQFKFGELANIELLGEMQGLLPSRAWKRTNKGTIWFPGETVITGIGQGFLVSTPIQLATSLSILTNKGKYIQPHLIKHTKQKATIVEDIAINILPEHWDIIHKGMIESVDNIKGTAYAIKNNNYLIAGKSGTSQVYGKKEKDVYLKDTETPQHLKNHALFIAFAPADDPEIAVVVVAEHGASGSKTAAPIAGVVIEKYLTDILQATTTVRDR